VLFGSGDDFTLVLTNEDLGLVGDTGIEPVTSSV
jgi:hypothetical protein